MSLTINTNLSSMMVCMNLSKSTFSLNEAMERMTTGYKINHAKDNAAGYSIAQNMVSQLSSYDVVSDNISMGMDLVTTAQDTIGLMQKHGERIHSLITQAQNGTYGQASLDAINSEVGARIAEINRIYNNAQYNGINILQSGMSGESQNVLMNNVNRLLSSSNLPTSNVLSTEERISVLPDWASEIYEGSIKPKENGFISNIYMYNADVIITDPTELADAIENNTKIGIANAETLAELAKIVNGTDGYTANNCVGKSILLTNDIDLESYCAEHTDSNGNGGWTPIGINYSNSFEGTFDGQGHVIKNLYINTTSTMQGLFGLARTVKNVGVVDADVTGGNYTGAIAGCSSGSYTYSNCYSTGTIKGGTYTGGIAGYTHILDDSYSTADVSGNGYVGGLVGHSYYGFTNSFSTGDVTGSGDYVGGITGYNSYGTFNHCYSTGDVSGKNYVGGIAGLACSVLGSLLYTYSTGNVSGEKYVGGLTGYFSTTQKRIVNCFTIGDVSGTNMVGGLIGRVWVSYTNNENYIGEIQNVACLGNVTGETSVGSFLGSIQYGEQDGILNITNVSVLDSKINAIGSEKRYDGTPCSSGQMDGWMANITTIAAPEPEPGPAPDPEPTPTLQSGITLQVGINGNSSSQISFNCGFIYDLSSILTNGAEDSSSYDVINSFLSMLSDKATSLGAISNRLESALESTSVAMNNLTSSLSTTRDADVAKESSNYIKSQILQQASATLLATVNQSPSIALQLL